ncbi:pyruvate, phosphate dikinase [Flavobacterium pectinovorum]|uniref:pyruvate, phosphate dikinase n=1 Tax=Flavobacterium pectinovorum TaxID=29533 RepID=UPI001FAC5104|nr:pyruvate, phosphate dikinase [Flavobacterium pectinovorum]MCI9845508.1 pyruvate, phosphate dikinase [Flavobacterium pectinovorum]
MGNLTKTVFIFGDKKAEGNAEMKNLLGGKGANLAEMNLLRIPVPPGFTITTEMCKIYLEEGQDKLISIIKNEVTASIKFIEERTGTRFSDAENPCLVSVRSGSRASMPGMMDTILNLGINENIVEGLIKKTNNARFVWDSYRRFIQMYGRVVMNIRAEAGDFTDPFEEILEKEKKQKCYQSDNDFNAEDLKNISKSFKQLVKKSTGKDFPNDPWEQLWGAVSAVFESWMNERAVYYRELNNLPQEWGTAVNVQAMVFGNMGQNSATGVAFTRDASTGEKIFNGEFLINAQGEDVVAGTRTPRQITAEGSRRWASLSGIGEDIRCRDFPSLEEMMPEIYQELAECAQMLELHFKDMQDIEFTVQEGKLWILQTRNGKRTGTAMVKMAVDLLHENLLDEKTALLRVDPKRLDELLHPIFDQDEIIKACCIGQGLPASPGASSGRIVFFTEDAQVWSSKGENVILVRMETSPEDLKGMVAAQGILTARGGMTSHAAVVARGMGKCCIAGAESLKIDYKQQTIQTENLTFKQGDWISLDGSTGKIYKGKLKTSEGQLSGDFEKLMDLADQHARLQIRSNADTPMDVMTALRFGAKGIGLCRTEHMFFDDDKIMAMREMILADNEAGRRKALAKLLPMQRKDFEDIFRLMNGLPVNIRLLDPPLHEFVPHDEKIQKELADELGIPHEIIKKKIESLYEFNPMMGHRGCRLGTTYPEISEMQTAAILEAALHIKYEGIESLPEIMIPLTGTVEEMKMQKKIINQTAEKVFEQYDDRIPYLLGTMIEVPRAALIADKIAEHAEFFSFGTNDLTQMTYGYSRDDSGKFLPMYLEKSILKHDPFQILDQEGVGQLITMAIKKGKAGRANLKIGICGEHGGEPGSVEFCHNEGLNYVSCSPYRVPIARLAAAHAAINEENNRSITSRQNASKAICFENYHF